VKKGLLRDFFDPIRREPFCQDTYEGSMKKHILETFCGLSLSDGEIKDMSLSMQGEFFNSSRPVCADIPLA
jgi:hypothetical protein